MLIASFAFAAMGVFVKRLGKDFDTVEIVLFRNLFGVVFMLISIWQKPLVQTGGKPFLLLFRGFIGTVALYAFAHNLVNMSLGEAFTFYQTSAFFIAFFSYFFLKGPRAKREITGMLELRRQLLWRHPITGT